MQILRNILYKTIATINYQPSEKFVLCYHSIGDSNWRFSIDVETFKQQIEYLEKHYKHISLGEILNPNTEPSYALTFDDGCADILSIKNFLAEKGIKPTLFVISDSANADKSELKNDLPFLTTEQIQQLIQSGWEIGSHSSTHSDFNKLDKYGINTQIVQSKQDLEAKLGVQIKYFSYPRGRYNDDIVSAVKQAGYEMAVTMDDGKIDANTNPYLIPRIGIDKTHGFEQFKETILESVVISRKFIKEFAGGVIKNFI